MATKQETLGVTNMPLDLISTYTRADSAMDDFVLPEWGRRFNSDTSADSPWSRKIILSLDGGGIRGFASLLILDELMRRVKLLETATLGHVDGCSSSYPWYRSREDRNPGPKPRRACLPHHYFDYFFGTSTGGLSAIMLGRLQMSVPRALRQYHIVGTQVFGHPRKLSFMGLGRPRYKAERMNNALQAAMLEGIAPEVSRTENFQVDLPSVEQRITMQDLGPEAKHQTGILQNKAKGVRLRAENPDSARTIVVANGGATQRGTYLFRSYDHPAPSPAAGEDRSLHLNHGPASDAAIWKTARATSAAPGYFSMIKIGDGRFEDGGMGANNPVRLAYDEVKQMHFKREPLLILSIGTGVQNADQWEEDGPFRPLKHLVRMARDFHDLKQKITDSEQTHRQFNGHVRDRNNELSKEDKIHYFRFNLKAIADISLDEWQPLVDGSKTKERMRTAVNSYLEDGKVSDELNECASILVERRRERARTERWERFAQHLTYCCPEERCESVIFTSRKDLRQHAIDFHGFVWRIGCCTSESGARNTHSGRYTCIWDHCGEQQVSIFETSARFEDHLREVHNFPDPHIMESEEFERWLDRGRMTPEEAASRQQTGLSSGSQQDGKHRVNR